MSETVSLEEALRPFGKDFVVVSASKADRTERENDARNAHLVQMLEDAGFTPHPAKGHYTYEDGTATDENSYVVHGIPEPLKLLLGSLYDQESVLDEHGLHFISKGTLAPFRRRDHYIGPSAREQPAWIEYPLGRSAVSFAIDFEREHKF